MYGTNHNLVDKYIDKTNFAIHWILIYPLNIVHLMYGPEGKQFWFLKSPDVSWDEVEGNIRAQGKTKLTSFPRDHTLSVLLYI